VLSDEELELGGVADIESDDDGGVAGVASEEEAGVSAELGGVVDCVVVSELGGELSAAVPAACCRAQPDASASALSDKTIRARFIRHLVTGIPMPPTDSSAGAWCYNVRSATVFLVKSAVMRLGKTWSRA
jgi:hypothetical protein